MRYYPRLMLVLVFLLVILPFVSISQDRSKVTEEVQYTHAQDITAPTIEQWGIIGNPEDGGPFDVWALVFDSGSGIRNVSLVTRPIAGQSTKTLLSSNGTHYLGTGPPLVLNATYRVFIEAFDQADNVRTSYIVNIDRINTITDIDASFTMPVVVGVSLAVMVAVLALGYLYDQRTPRVPMTDPLFEDVVDDEGQDEDENDPSTV